MGFTEDLIDGLKGLTAPEQVDLSATKEALSNLQKQLMTLEEVKGKFNEDLAKNNLALDPEAQAKVDTIFSALEADATDVDGLAEASLGAYAEKILEATVKKMSFQEGLIFKIKNSELAMQAMEAYLGFMSFFSDPDEESSSFHKAVLKMNEMIHGKGPEQPPANPAVPGEVPGQPQGAEAPASTPPPETSSSETGLSEEELNQFKKEVAEQKNFYTLMQHEYLTDPSKQKGAQEVILAQVTPALEKTSKARMKEVTPNGFTLSLAGNNQIETQFTVLSDGKEIKLRRGEGASVKETLWDGSQAHLALAINELDPQYQLETPAAVS